MHSGKSPIGPAKIKGQIRHTVRQFHTSKGTRTDKIHMICHVTTRRYRHTPNNRYPYLNTGVLNPYDGKPSNTNYLNSVDVIDDVLLPELNSQEFIFDTHEYRRWHRIFDFKYDAAASVINAKCRNYSTKLMPFEMTTADDLKHKMIWIYPPTDKINSILNHFETLRQENPDSIAAVIILPRIVSTGTEYKSIY